MGWETKFWCFTYFEVENREQLAKKFPSGVAYAIWQYERGEETGRLHLQGYMEMHRSVALACMKKILPGAHWGQRKGTSVQARNYCTPTKGKGDEVDPTYIAGPWEHGVFTPPEGATNLMLEIVERVKNGCPLTTIAAEHPLQYLRCYKGLDALQQALCPKRKFKTEVIVRWGSPGSGKTRWVMDNYESDDIYNKPEGDWFCGYAGQPVVLLDDFYGDIKYSLLLKVLDRYPLLAAVKGSHVQFCPRVIVITSNSHPWFWYKSVNDKTALMRRLTSITKVGDPNYVGRFGFMDAVGPLHGEELESAMKAENWDADKYNGRPTSTCLFIQPGDE